MKSLFANILGLVALVSLASFVAADDKKEEKGKQEGNATKLVGKWEVTKSDGNVPIGSTVEFTKDGKFSVAISANGMELKIEGTYKVEKDQLLTEAKINDQKVEDTDVIKKLTADALELEGKDKSITVLKKK